MFYLAPEQEIFQPHPREARVVETVNWVAALSGVVFVLSNLFSLASRYDSWSAPLLFLPFAIAPICIPPFWWAFRPCPHDYSHELKLNLARLAGWSYFAMFHSLAIILRSRNAGEDAIDLALPIVFMNLMLALFLLAAVNYARIRHASVRWAPFLRMVVVGGIVGFCALAATPHLEKLRIAANESFAIRSLNKLSAAEFQYAASHPTLGFAHNLSLLDPSFGKETTAQYLAEARKHSYEIVLGATESNANEKNSQFVLMARPSRFQREAVRSFYMDQSGEVHFTSENRSATARDQPLR